jgi:hypothetical protein
MRCLLSLQAGELAEMEGKVRKQQLPYLGQSELPYTHGPMVDWPLGEGPYQTLLVAGESCIVVVANLTIMSGNHAVQLVLGMCAYLLGHSIHGLIAQVPGAKNRGWLTPASNRSHIPLCHALWWR